MSRIFMDGFESGDLGLWTSSSGVVLNSSLAGRTGNYCADLRTLTDYMTKSVDPDDEYYLAFKCYIDTTPSDKPGLFSACEGAIQHFTVSCHQTTGIINVYVGFTILVSSSLPISFAVWNLIEAYLKIANSGGRITIKVNGITFIDFTGDTMNGGTGVVNLFSFGYAAYSNSFYGYSYFDDIIIDNANWIGPSSIKGLAVTGAGATTQFDPSTGNNYACVDEIPPSDVDYISTNIPNEIDTYACGDLTGTINSVKAVQVQARCMQEGSPAVPKVQLVTRPSSTDRVSASKDVQTFQPGTVANIWELNPDDSAAWESADVNGMEIGVKAVAS